MDGNCTSDCHYTKVMEETDAIDDATAGMLVVVLLFVLPAVPSFWPFTSKNRRKLQSIFQLLSFSFNFLRH